MAHLRHRLCWQGRITTGLENISRQMGQISCFSRLSMLCASPSSGLKPTVKFIPSAIVPTLALALVLAFSHCLWTLPRVLSTVFRLCSLLLLTPETALCLLSLPQTICLSLDSCFQTLLCLALVSALYPGQAHVAFSLPLSLNGSVPGNFSFCFPNPSCPLCGHRCLSLTPQRGD